MREGVCIQLNIAIETELGGFQHWGSASEARSDQLGCAPGIFFIVWIINVLHRPVDSGIHKRDILESSQQSF